MTPSDGTTDPAEPRGDDYVMLSPKGVEAAGANARLAIKTYLAIRILTLAAGLAAVFGLAALKAPSIAELLRQVAVLWVG
jgi:hypothetical protein